MNNLYNDLTDCTSLLYNLLENMDKEAKELEAKAKRIKELNRILVYRIQNNKITNIKDVECALSWLNHSNLTIDEILEKIS